MIKVVRGEPTPEELAVIVTVVAAKASGGTIAPEPAAPSQWNAPARLVRRPLRPGPGAWRASAWPS
ncbi:acyl-CoA carboxylase subunit epsilon [Embleya scabrispora]|uniref:acyl-CoA carboxylase subunit epsilon n=1 Tax=Embleya scabrispora TaxID=159449 RepID=UPI000365C431|nr:acyl-CoA carboxylase subunit epsilon [Embleya scabrispora]MYS79351.1 acyl-CoA carboxylase subunit epsilon [Streptomyces sp. SID5474]